MPSMQILVAWSPTGGDRKVHRTIVMAPGSVRVAERMPLAAGDPPPVDWVTEEAGTITLQVTEAPVYIHCVMP